MIQDLNSAKVFKVGKDDKYTIQLGIDTPQLYNFPF